MAQCAAAAHADVDAAAPSLIEEGTLVVVASAAERKSAHLPGQLQAAVLDTPVHTGAKRAVGAWHVLQVITR